MHIFKTHLELTLFLKCRVQNYCKSYLYCNAWFTIGSKLATFCNDPQVLQMQTQLYSCFGIFGLHPTETMKRLKAVRDVRLLKAKSLCHTSVVTIKTCPKIWWKEAW